jgi:1,6-anhydro-N-acetylmuramate kinase
LHSLTPKKGTLFITGGGAYNDFLIERIQFHLPSIKIIIPENTILEFKEAVIFALLGVLKLRGQINVLSSVTGAKTDHSSGISTNQNNISNTQFALYYFFIFVKIKHIAINERFIKEIRK